MINEFEYCPPSVLLGVGAVTLPAQSGHDGGHLRPSGRGRRRRPDGRGRRSTVQEGEVRRVEFPAARADRQGGHHRAERRQGRAGRGQARPGEPCTGRPGCRRKSSSATIGLLLRDNGYQCSEGEIYFAETRKRATILPSTTLWWHTRSVDSSRSFVAAAASPTAPPPLVDSPKCPRCSLVGICLPDETNLHAGRSAAAPRRLTPRDSAARPLYVTEQGARVGIRSGRVVVTKDREELQQLRLIDVSQISLYGNVQVSSQMIRAAFREEIPVCWFSYGGWFQGIAEGLPSKHVELRRRQVAIAAQAGLPIAQSMIEGKLRNSRTFLRRNARSDVGRVLDQLKSLAEAVGGSESIESLLGMEGTGARLYFSKFSSMVREQSLGPFDFNGRNRRPPRDPVNCLLSYVYALLTKDLTAVAIAVGFDPYLGVFHRPRFGRPALALDLAEEFRPPCRRVRGHQRHQQRGDRREGLPGPSGRSRSHPGRQAVSAVRLRTKTRHRGNPSHLRVSDHVSTSVRGPSQSPGRPPARRDSLLHPLYDEVDHGSTSAPVASSV